MEKVLLKYLVGDGRKAIPPIEPREGTFPIPIRRNMARSLINHLLDTGYSWHSSQAGTLWVVEQFCKEVGLEYACNKCETAWTFYLIDYMRFRDNDWVVYRGRTGMIVDCLTKPDYCEVQFDQSGMFRKVLHQNKLSLATDDEIAVMEGVTAGTIKRKRNAAERIKWQKWLENGFSLRTRY